MKLLLCGAGAIARELLGQLGDSWQVRLVDNSEEELRKTADIHPTICSQHVGDASSALTLEKAGLADADYVVAVTGDDKVNATIADLALKSDAANVVTLVTDHESAARLREAGAYVLQPTQLMSSQLYHYLQDPRIRVMPLSLVPGTVMEVKASEYMRTVGKRARFFDRDNARLVALKRGGELVFPEPDTLLHADDILVILGDPTVFQSVCTLLECSNPSFPLSYGPGMLVLAANGSTQGQGLPPVAGEALYLARHTQVKNVTLLHSADEADYAEQLTTWPQVQATQMHLDPEATSAADLANAVRDACRDSNYGLVVVPPFEESYVLPMGSPTYMRLAHDIHRPLLISRATVPIQRILVAFNGSAMSELALEVAVDIAQQLEAKVAVVLVDEPEFLTGESGDGWEESVKDRLKELRHIHKQEFGVLLRHGNPVRQIAAETEKHDLLVVGSRSAHRTLLTPNIAESLARKAACSTLILAV